ncbi:MAG: hypothetical protein K6G16_01505 [Lachnospiraceae bacterium]|nr:hypothetical protein [Lachnospiraceae bacterium]
MYTQVSLSFISVLEDLLADIFNQWLLPALMLAFEFLWDLAVGMIVAFLNDLFFRLFTMLLKVLLILEKIFDVFSCTVGVYVQDANGQMVATSGYVDVTKNSSLIDVLMHSDPIVNAVLGMTAGAFALCFLITIFAVIRSMGEGIGELKRPVSHVLRQTAKACLTFALIPLVCIFTVKLAGTTITAVKKYMPNSVSGAYERDAATRVSEALSNTTGMPKRGSKQSSIEKAIAASRIPTANEETRACDLIFYLIVKDALRNKSNEQYYLSGQHFQNTIVAKEDIDLAQINWLYAFFETLLVIILFLKLIVECMVRVFMLLILFVVSPYFVAMMPLDDGAKFKRWKEMFVGFTISVFGPIIAMKTYLVLLPYVVTNSTLDLGFGEASYYQRANQAITNAINSAISGGEAAGRPVTVTEGLFRLFFIAAGAFAVYKSQKLMLDLINPEVSRFLSMSSSGVDAMVSKGLGAATSGVSTGVEKGVGALQNALSKTGGGNGDSGGQGGSSGGGAGGGGGEK